MFAAIIALCGLIIGVSVGFYAAATMGAKPPVPHIEPPEVTVAEPERLMAPAVSVPAELLYDEDTLDVPSNMGPPPRSVEKDEYLAFDEMETNPEADYEEDADEDAATVLYSKGDWGDEVEALMADLDIEL